MITISIKDAVLLILLVALLVLIIYLIVMVSNLIKTLKKANIVLDDVSRMSAIAADKTEAVNHQVDSYVEKFANIISSIRTEGTTMNKLYNRAQERILDKKDVKRKRKYYDDSANQDMTRSNKHIGGTRKAIK